MYICVYICIFTIGTLTINTVLKKSSHTRFTTSHEVKHIFKCKISLKEMLQFFEKCVGLHLCSIHMNTRDTMMARLRDPGRN